MRYSEFTPREMLEPIARDASNLEFFVAALRTVKPADHAAAILLVGGNDPRSLALRQAQAPLRFDRRVSRWSHAALIRKWDLEQVARSSGVEVSLEPARIEQQVPERNGVTPFELSRYLDESRFLNLALCFPHFTRQAERRQLLLASAANPNRDRQRYPLWDLLARWAQYSYDSSGPNPLLDNVPLPGAAFCEYVYESAGIDLTPGATGNHCCPEVLYSTMQYWQDGLEAQQEVSFTCLELVRDEVGAPQKRLAPILEPIEPEPAVASRTRPAVSKKKRAPRRAKRSAR
jgi:hypothetical protein